MFRSTPVRLEMKAVALYWSFLTFCNAHFCHFFRKNRPGNQCGDIQLFQNSVADFHASTEHSRPAYDSMIFFSAISLLSDLLGRTVNLLNDNVNMLSGNFAWFGEKGGCVLRFCVCSSERLEIPPGKKKAKLLIHFLGKISSFCPLRGLSHTSGVVRTCRVKKHQQWCSGTKGWVCHYS